MAIKKYHVSKNLFDKDNATIYNAYLNTAGDWLPSSDSRSVKIPCNPNTQYTLSVSESLAIFRIYSSNNANITPDGERTTPIAREENTSQFTFTTGANTACIIFQGSATTVDTWFNSLMFEEGATAHDYEPYGDSFKDWFYREYGTETETFTSLPQTIIGDGQPISSWSMKGNMQQSGTPTPSNPVYPQETGDKTANLFDVGSYSSAILTNCTIAVTNDVLTQTNSGMYARSAWKIDGLQVGTDYIMAIKITNPNQTECQIRIYDSTNSSEIRSSSASKATSITLSVTFTAATSTHYIRIYSNTSGTANSYTVNFTNIMLNSGSTALPYEPYGQYKIPILSNGVSYPIYLSEPIRKIGDSVDTAPSTGTASHIIKKIVFDGSEEWTKASGGSIFFTSINNVLNVEGISTQCSHYIAQNNVTSATSVNNLHSCTRSDSLARYYIRDNTYSTAESFITFLQQQYSNGTPVTVWYVLATAQTETFTAPSIPTTGTAESFDVSTTLKPSEVSLTYHGWHEHSDTKYTSG